MMARELVRLANKPRVKENIMSVVATNLDHARIAGARRGLIFVGAWLALTPVAFAIFVANIANPVISVPACIFFCLAIFPLMAVVPQALEYRDARKGITVD
jgi:hypothetical protein